VVLFNIYIFISIVYNAYYEYNDVGIKRYFAPKNIGLLRSLFTLSQSWYNSVSI